MTLLLGSLIHLANVMLLVSFLMKDIMGLRIVSITASLCFIAYFATRGTPLWDVVAWNAVFMVVNVYQIIQLWKERRPVPLDGTQEAIRRAVFPELSARNFLRLLGVGRFRKAASGDRIVKKGEPLSELYLVTEGDLEVRLPNDGLISLQKGQFVGEMSYLTGEAPRADVAAVTGVHYLAWPQSELKTFLEKEQETKLAVVRVLGQDLVRKLRTAQPTKS